MVYVTGDKEAIRAYEMRQMALSDYTSGINYAHEEGHRQGMAKGRQESILEIARKMKNAGRPLSEIMEFTGLSTEIIERM